jgi:hypothetical protein
VLFEKRRASKTKVLQVLFILALTLIQSSKFWKIYRSAKEWQYHWALCIIWVEEFCIRCFAHQIEVLFFNPVSTSL